MFKNNKYLKYKQKYIYLIGGAPSDTVYHKIESGKENENFHIYNENGEVKTNFCSICLDEYILYDRITLLKCNHYLHKKCLCNQRRCPLCRQVIAEKKNLYYYIIPNSDKFELTEYQIDKNELLDKTTKLSEFENTLVELGEMYDENIRKADVNFLDILKLIKTFREFKNNIIEHINLYKFTVDEIEKLEAYNETIKKLILILIDYINNN